jgi:hypothetical protein
VRRRGSRPAAPQALPQVVVSKPLVREVDSRLGFLGQFSAVEHVELRAQVGGTLTEINFKVEISFTRAISSSQSIRVPTKSGWRRRMRSLKPPQRALRKSNQEDHDRFSAGVLTAYRARLKSTEKWAEVVRGHQGRLTGDNDRPDDHGRTLLRHFSRLSRVTSPDYPAPHPSSGCLRRESLLERACPHHTDGRQQIRRKA